MVKYTKIYSGGIPILKEDDIFKTIIPLTNENYNKKEEYIGDKPAINRQ